MNSTSLFWINNEKKKDQQYTKDIWHIVITQYTLFCLGSVELKFFVSSAGGSRNDLLDFNSIH